MAGKEVVAEELAKLKSGGKAKTKAKDNKKGKKGENSDGVKCEEDSTSEEKDVKSEAVRKRRRTK